MLIRLASIGDIPSIHHLAHQIWWATYAEILSAEQIEFMLHDMYSSEALQNQMTGGIQFIVAEKTEPLGFAGYSPATEGSATKIHKLYISPAQQGKGVGSALIRYILEETKKIEGSSLELNVNRNNPALQFYLKKGFQIKEEVDIPYYQFTLNDYVLEYTIPPSGSSF
ncbi:GNAT family N-acetyltransferase [Pedobacter sp. SYSU D00535]|uniref:GNAT family N-acetyltransferase n=1 Tax=Pedobacter sp. SYSU D00535 TaxID=2810308 RepID=UPI001A95CF63|nr:GNAT family N-acetyltransferase [Pedobacter sp. SYSU D00535]